MLSQVRVDFAQLLLTSILYEYNFEVHQWCFLSQYMVMVMMMVWFKPISFSREETEIIEGEVVEIQIDRPASGTVS